MKQTKDIKDIINTMDIEKLSELACLSLNESEKSSLLCDLRDMLDFAESLVSHEIPESTPINEEKESVVREDLPSPCMPRDELLAAARSRTDAYLSVPRVIGGGDHE